MAGFTIHVNSTTIVASGGTNALQVYNVLVDVIRTAKMNTALGMSEAESTLISNLQCTIKWKRGGERVMFNKVTHLLDAVLRCRKPAVVTITTTEQIKYKGVYYEIVDLYDYNNLGKLLVIALRKIK